MKQTNEDIIEKGKNLLYTAATKSGVEFVFCDDEHDGITYDDEERLSFSTSLKALPFATDDGEVEPEPVTFDIQYERDDGDFWMLIGEHGEEQITYGNVMAAMYFDLVCQSAR